MILTDAQLHAIMPNARERVELFTVAINAALAKFNIQDPPEVAMWLAQIAHESGELHWLHELWGPTPAQRGYEGRADLGNTQPGDGSRFRGRGLIQITGRANYAHASEALYGDARLLTSPELLEQRDGACASAAWFWSDFKHLGPVAAPGDMDAFIAVTRRINGGTNGLADRVNYWSKAKQALGVAQ